MATVIGADGIAYTVPDAAGGGLVSNTVGGTFGTLGGQGDFNTMPIPDLIGEEGILQEQFNSQPIDAQMNQIRSWFQQNPNATENDMIAAMRQYGVSAQMVARAMGNTPIPNAPAVIQVAQYQNITGNRSDINDINRAIVARNLGVSADELASLGGMSLEQAQALTARAAEQNPQIGQVSQDQIRAFVMANPNLSDQQFYQMMNQYGVNPVQVSQALGIDVTDVLQRQQNAAQQAAEFIPTGLSGFEQATQRGVTDVTGTLRAAQTEARAALDPAMEEVARLYNLNIEGLQQAGTQAQGALESAFTGAQGLRTQSLAELQQAEARARADLATQQELQRGLYNQNIRGLEQAGTTARGDIERTFGTASGYFDPYRQAGTTALQQELALSGALGQDAFNQAYQESPYVRFLREQGERSTLAGAAATGGLGGGRVQQELVRFGQGLAGQGLQQQIQNLRSLSGQGLQASGAGADIQTALGTNLANLGRGTAQDIANQRLNLANIEGQYGINLSNLGTSTAQNRAAERGLMAGEQMQYGTNIANLLRGTAQDVGTQRTNLAGERSQYGTNLANLATSTGTNIANVQGAAAQNIANQRALAGQQLANQIANTSLTLADYANMQGTNLAGTLTNFGTAGLNLSQTAIANQIAAQQAAAQQEAQAQENYAGQQSSMLSGQPFYQQQPFSYGQAAGNAMNAAALGYYLGGGPAGSQYTRPTQLPAGMGNPTPVAGGSPASYLNNPQVNSLMNTNLIAARLGGIR